MSSRQEGDRIVEADSVDCVTLNVRIQHIHTPWLCTLHAASSVQATAAKGRLHCGPPGPYGGSGLGPTVERLPRALVRVGLFDGSGQSLPQYRSSDQGCFVSPFRMSS